MNTKNKISIHFAGLNPKETALFDRVISFNVTHGLEADIIEDAANADLIISSSELFSHVEKFNKSKTLLVITNDEHCSKGDLQVQQPLMITKVMNLLTEAITITQEKMNTVRKTQETGFVNVNIESVDITATSASSSIAPTESIEVIENVTDIKKHHALIIDDSAAIRKQLELELRDAGISSDFAECGEDALEKIKDNHFDLVFLDIIMPGLDGYETCQAMRSNINYKKTPIIMLSGKTSPLDEVKGVIAGATTYLTKPVKSDKLQETLNRVTKWIENYAPPKKSETV